MKDIPNMNEQIFVSTLLHEMNGKASTILDIFSGWMIGGFAATAALLVSQFDSVAKHLDPHVIHGFLIIFLWSLVLVILQKFIAVLVASASQGASVGREAGEKTKDIPTPLNIEIVLAELKNSIFPPMRWFVGRSYSKLMKGDLVSCAQNLTRIAQIQGLLCLVQVVLVLVAVFKIAFSFHA